MKRFLPLPSLLLAACATLNAADWPVSNGAEFREAASKAKPGDRILLAPGNYGGGFQFRNLRGEKEKPIQITARDPDNPPLFKGGSVAIHFSSPAYLELSHLMFSGQSGNGLNIDDGPEQSLPASHIVLRHLRITRIDSNQKTPAGDLE